MRTSVSYGDSLIRISSYGMRSIVYLYASNCVRTKKKMYRDDTRTNGLDTMWRTQHDRFHAVWQYMQAVSDRFNMHAFLSQMHLQQRAMLEAHKTDRAAHAHDQSTMSADAFTTHMKDVSAWCDTKAATEVISLSSHEMSNPIQASQTDAETPKILHRRRRVQSIVYNTCHAALCSVYNPDYARLALEYLTDLMLLYHDAAHVDSEHMLDQCHSLFQQSESMRGLMDLLNLFCMHDKARFSTGMASLATQADWCDWIDSL